MRRVPIAGTMLLFGLIACTEQPTAPSSAGPHPSFDFTNGPPNPGPIILRLAGAPFAEFDNDPVRNLMTLYFPTSNNVFCGGTEQFNTADIQLLSAPSGAFQQLIVNKQMNVTAYATADFSELFDPDFPTHTDRFCSFIAGPKKIAEGTVNFLESDHFLPQNVKVGVSAEGFVSSVPGGQTLHLVDKQVGVLKGGNLVFVVEDITLNPVP